MNTYNLKSYNIIVVWFPVSAKVPGAGTPQATSPTNHNFEQQGNEPAGYMAVRLKSSCLAGKLVYFLPSFLLFLPCFLPCYPAISVCLNLFWMHLLFCIYSMSLHLFELSSFPAKRRIFLQAVDCFKFSGKICGVTRVTERQRLQSCFNHLGCPYMRASSGARTASSSRKKQRSGRFPFMVSPHPSRLPCWLCQSMQTAWQLQVF